MRSWGAFFAAAVGPLAKKVLVALGVGIVTYTGFSVIVGQISAAVTAGFGGLPGDVYAIVALAGFVDAAGVWLAALSASVALLAMKRFALLS